MTKENINALPVAIRSLKDPMSLALINALLEREPIDIILNTTSFAANPINNLPINNISPHLQTHNNKTLIPEQPPLFVKNIPVIQLILAANSHEDWQENPIGFTRARFSHEYCPARNGWQNYQSGDCL